MFTYFKMVIRIWMVQSIKVSPEVISGTLLVDGWMNEWIYGWLDRIIKEFMDIWMNKWMVGWMDGWMNE